MREEGINTNKNTNNILMFKGQSKISINHRIFTRLKHSIKEKNIWYQKNMVKTKINKK